MDITFGKIMNLQKSGVRTEFEKKQDYKEGLKDKYDIYQAEVDIKFPSEETIDTVFDENDYRKFLEKVEYFALEYEKTVQ